MSESTQPRPPRRLPRAVRIGLVVAAALVLLPVVALPVLAWAFDVGGVVKKQLLVLKPGWERKIGRSLDLGAVSVRLFPTIAVEVHDVVVQAEPERAKAGGPAAEPLFKVGGVRVAIAAWPLLTSLGKDVRIGGVDVSAPAIHVVRFADGRLSYQDILDRLAAEDQARSEPMSPETLEYVNGVRLARAAIVGATLAFHDLEGSAGAPAGGTTYLIEQLDIVATAAQLGQAFPITVDAAAFAPGRNLHLGVTVGPIPRDLVLGPPSSLIERVQLRLQAVQIEPLLRFLPPPTGIGVRRALVEADLAVDLPAHAGKITVKGSLGAKQLVLMTVAVPGPSGLPGAAAIGEPTDVALRADLRVDPVAGDVEAPLLDLTVGEMGVGGKIDVRSAYTRPQIRSLDLQTRAVTFERIAAMLPAGSMPKGGRFSGPIVLGATATGTADDAQVSATLDLDGASILMPTLRKPAGTALRGEFKGRVQPQIIDIKRLALVLGTLAVAVHGTATPAADFDLQLDSIKASIDPLVRLLPSVQTAIPAGTSVGGELALEGHVKKKGKSLDGDVRLALTSAALRTPALELVGAAGAIVKLRAGAGDTIDASLDLGAARIMVPGSVSKAAGVPMKIVVGVDRVGDRLTVREASVDAPGAELKAKGFSDSKAHRLELSFTRCEIDLGKLASVVPMLRDKDTLPAWLADAKIHMGLGINGDPARLDTIHVHVDDLDLAVASGHIRGHADVVGLDAPKTVGFQLAATGIDLDRILGTEPATDKPSGGDKAPVVPRVLKTLALDGRVQIDRGRVKGISFSNFDGKVALTNGKGRFDTLKLDMFEGNVIADGSTIDLNPSPPRFSLRSRFQNVQFGELIAFQSPALGKRFDGRGSVDVKLDGAGLSWAQIAPQLAGQVGLAFADARFKMSSIGGAALGQIFQRVQGLGAGTPAQSGDEISLRNLSTKLQVSDGQLRTTAPLTLPTKSGLLSLAGGIGLDQRLGLIGAIAIPPDVITQLTQGRIRLDGALPVSLKLGGSLLSPEVQVVDLVKTAGVLAGSLLKTQGAAVLQGALGKELGDKVGGAAGKVLGAGSVDAAAAEARKQLEDEARRRLQQEQAKLTERLRQEAAARVQQAAQKQLEDEANKRLPGGLGGLFGK